ncbi:MAG: hypothetical protein K0S80_4491, partial [Neobacillus sp.]|nr:hypothetical protein [Neobacillus sp.]
MQKEFFHLCKIVSKGNVCSTKYGQRHEMIVSSSWDSIGKGQKRQSERQPNMRMGESEIGCAS